MHIFLTAGAELVVESRIVTLRGIQPVLNGTPLDSRAQIRHNDDQEIVLQYDAPALAGGFFLVRIRRENESRAWLRYSIERPGNQVVLDSFGLRFRQIENLRAYLRNGYSSWDGSEYIQLQGEEDSKPAEGAGTTGFAMTQLLPDRGMGSLVVGFDRHDRFQQPFTFDQHNDPSLTIQTLWDRKDRTELLACDGEGLVIFEHPEIEEALREWARLVAAASPTPPRRTPPIIGWCSWYNLYGYITEENILEHLRGVAEVKRHEQFPMQVFQIDDGFTPEMGDWLQVKPQFPRGMKLLLDDIRAAGFTPGLWIAPFMVGNRSHLFRDHPGWVVQDRVTGGPLVQMRFYGEFRWHKQSEEYYILDTTHPEAFEYLRRVFHTWRYEWGCEYFKTDFMHFGSAYGPDRAVWHTPGRSRIEIWRRVAEMIREEIGDRLWLGCGSPLWAAVGLVDGVRISHDVGVEWRGERTAEALIKDQPTRNFANGILWLADPDCILLRDRFHYLSDTEVRSLAIHAGIAAGVLMTSDALDRLSAGRIELWKLLLGLRRQCNYPLLAQNEPFVVAVQPGEQRHAIFILNPGETALKRHYPLTALGLPAPLYLFDWNTGHAVEQPVDGITVNLAAHDSILLFASPIPDREAPQQIA